MTRLLLSTLLALAASLKPCPGLDQATLDLALEAPALNTNPGPEYADANRPGNMIIGLDRTPKGRLWAAWIGNGDSANGFLMLASSDNGGKSWSKPRLVIDPTDLPGKPNRRTLVGNLWTDPQGRLWCFFDQSLGYFDGRGGDWVTRCDNPDDANPTWSAPVRIADGCTLNKPTVLANGDWLLPVSLWTRDRIGPWNKDFAGVETFRNHHRDLDAIRMANVYASSDQGKTWTRRGGVTFPGTDFDEHMIVERKDGSLWMLARAGKGISESTSNDGGRTWTTPTDSPILNPKARFFLRRLASGNLLLVKNGPVDIALPRRSSLTAFLSKDDGKTWGPGLLLDDRSSVSYPDGFQAPDGTIHILYDWNRHTDAEILLTKFTEADIERARTLAPDGVEWQRQLLTSGTPRSIVNKALNTPHPELGGSSVRPTKKWVTQAAEDAKQDFLSIPYEGQTPNRMVCDTTLRSMPDGSWALFMLAGGDFEPSPDNYIGVTRSRDMGRTWSPLAAVDVGFSRSGETIGQGATELAIFPDRSTLFFSTHARTWGNNWRSWMTDSPDGGLTWSKPVPLPGRLGRFTFMRKHIVTRDGRILVPFQHYLGAPSGTPPDPEEKSPWHGEIFRNVSNPRNGVIMSSDGGKTWAEHGNVRLTPHDGYHGWAENDLFERTDGSIVMIIRGDRLGGVLYQAVSKDGGRTWPEFASITEIPNPGSKATLYALGGDTVALLHNSNSKRRAPLSLWISFDGMKTWPYQRVLVPEAGPDPKYPGKLMKGSLNYPDGFVSADKQWLHFAYDDARHRAVHYSAKLPPLPAK
jgi:predicted neuraminidase